MDFSFVLREWEVLAIGAYHTVLVCCISLLLGFALGFVVCLLRMSAYRPLAAAGRVYISFFRGVPMLVQLLLIYYALPFAGINVPPLVATVIGLSVVAAAYQAEILRGGFQAIPNGQRDAARVLGLNPWTIRFRIELPQVMRLVMPSLINDAILLLKSSSLISAVGVLDVTRASQNIAASSLRPMEAYLAAAAIYCIFTAVLSALGSLLERRMTRADVAPASSHAV
jgi:polar amino acid transport system permease protein